MKHKAVLLFSAIRRFVKHQPEQLNQIISQQCQGAQNYSQIQCTTGTYHKSHYVTCYINTFYANDFQP